MTAITIFGVLTGSLFGGLVSEVYEIANPDRISTVPTNNSVKIETIAIESKFDSLESLIEIKKQPKTWRGSGGVICKFPINVISEIIDSYDLPLEVNIDSVLDKDGNNIINSKQVSEIDNFFEDLFLEVPVLKQCSNIINISGTLSLTPPSSVQRIILNISEGEHQFTSTDALIKIGYEKEEGNSIEGGFEPRTGHIISHTLEKNPKITFFDNNNQTIETNGYSSSSFGSTKNITLYLPTDPAKVEVLSINSYGETLEFPLLISLE